VIERKLRDTRNGNPPGCSSCRTFASYADLDDHLGARDRAGRIEAKARDSRRIGKERKVTGYMRVRTRDEGKIQVPAERTI